MAILMLLSILIVLTASVILGIRVFKENGDKPEKIIIIGLVVFVLWLFMFASYKVAYVV